MNAMYAPRGILHRKHPGFLNDLYSFDLSTLVWANISATARSQHHSPLPRVSHGLTSEGSKLYLFGGWNGGASTVNTN